MPSDDVPRRAASRDDERIVRAMFAAINARRFEDYLAHCDPQVVYEAPYYAGFGERRGTAELGAMLTAVGERFAEIDYRVVDLWRAADRPVVVAEVRGDHLIAATGNRYRNHYVNLIEFSGGRVIRWREFSNPSVYEQAAGNAGSGTGTVAS